MVPLTSIGQTEQQGTEASEEKMPLPSAEEKDLAKPENMFPSAEEYGTSAIQTQLDAYLDIRGWQLGAVEEFVRPRRFAKVDVGVDYHPVLLRMLYKAGAIVQLFAPRRRARPDY